MNNHGQKVWAKVDDQRQKYVGFLQSLVQQLSGGEDATQTRMADEFEALGCEVKEIKYRPQDLSITHEFADPSLMDHSERVAVMGRLRGTGGGRSLLFFAHPDAEPVADTEAWEHEPFEGEIENGRIYGWGVADDLMGVAVMTCALDAVVASGLKPKGDVILASTPSKGHARGIMAVMDHGGVADASVYLHPAESGEGLNEIKAFTSGQLRFRINVPGRLPDTHEPSHSAFWHLGVDPIEKAWVIYKALRELDERRGREVHHPALEEAIGRSTNLHVSHFHGGDMDHLTRFSPDCVLAGSVVFPPGETIETVRSQIIEAVEAAANGDPWLAEHPPQIEWLSGISSGTETPTDHPLYKTVSGAIVAVTGSEPHTNPLHSGSDIRNPRLYKGIPTVGLGSLSGNLTQNGEHDEWVDVEDFVSAVKVIGSVIVDWCGV